MAGAGGVACRAGLPDVTPSEPAVIYYRHVSTPEDAARLEREGWRPVVQSWQASTDRWVWLMRKDTDE